MPPVINLHGKTPPILKTLSLLLNTVIIAVAFFSELSSEDLLFYCSIIKTVFGFVYLSGYRNMG